MKRIGIVAAVRDEAEPLVAALHLSPQSVDNGTYALWSNEQGEILLITPGEATEFTTKSGKVVGRPGKVSAAVATTLLIERYAPDVIINAGTAAGIAAKGVVVGDIIVADYVASHDVHIPLPGYDEYGSRKVAVKDIELLKKTGLPYKLGTVSSGESFTTTPQHWRTMINNDTIAQEMEAAGIMQAAQIINYTQPVYFIKAITIAETETSSENQQASSYEQNFTLAMGNLVQFMIALVPLLHS